MIDRKAHIDTDERVKMDELIELLLEQIQSYKDRVSTLEQERRLFYILGFINGICGVKP